VQLVVPVVALYLPTAQFMHGVNPEVEEVPGGHDMEPVKQVDAPEYE